MLGSDKLDQLWYTWSTAGLGAMNMEYRVRAASPGLSDTNSMRYRRLDRLLRYELPLDMDPSMLDQHTAPITLMFIKNGNENLLIRKVFKGRDAGRDAAGRYSVYFTHLIAGLPPTFTAREAISMWDYPRWADSEQGKPANDTYLEPIAYSEIENYVKVAQPRFDFSLVRQPLIEMLLTVLTNNLPNRIHITGRSELIAAYIYGLTHCLPKTMFGGLTFSTYESNPQEGETAIVGTMSGAELAVLSPLRVQTLPPTVQAAQVHAAIQKYAGIAVQSVAGNMTKLNSVINAVEESGNASTQRLIEVFNRRFRQTPLSYQQMIEIVSNPRNKDNQEDLTDIGTASDSVALLLQYPQYWKSDGESVFAHAIQQINTPNKLDPQTQAALATFINAVATLLFDAMKTKVLEAPQTNNLDELVHCTLVFSVLAPLKEDRPLWLRLLQEYAQSSLYEAVTANVLWDFQFWIVKCAMKLEPLPELQLVRPWLRISSWEKLSQALGLDLPSEWANDAIWNLLRRAIPKEAVGVVEKHEAKFRAMLQWLLQQQQPEYTAIVTNFFATLVTMGYSKRVEMLLFLLKVTPGIMDGLLASMPPMTDRQLLAREIETLLEGCGPEVINAANSSQILPVYIQQYVLDLKLDKISQEPVFLLLSQLSQGGMLPSPLASLVQNWLIIGHFLRSNQLSQGNLVQVGQALQAIMQTKQNEPGISSREQFINTFIPLLVQKVGDEYDLGIILEAFVPSLIDSRWGLLRRLAQKAGAIFIPAKDYYHLTPYLLRGLREYASNTPRAPQSELDQFLGWLYSGADNNRLNSITEGLSSTMWPEWMFREWDSWRKRVTPNFVQRLLPGQKHQTDPQPAPMNNAGPARPANNATWGEQRGSTQGQLVLAQGGGQQVQVNYGTVTPNQLSPQVAPAIVPATPVAYLTAYQNRLIEGNYYQNMHTTMPWVLRYWTTWLNENRDRGYAKTNAYEAATTQEILNDLQSHKDAVSRNLVNYLVDNLLIKAEIDELIKQNQQNSAFFDPNRMIDFHLRQLRASAPDLWSQSALQQYAEQPLRLLIRRHLFLQYLEDHGKRNLKKWIEDRRKDAKVKYM